MTVEEIIEELSDKEIKNKMTAEEIIRELFDIVKKEKIWWI